jgi:hypothetical protein
MASFNGKEFGVLTDQEVFNDYYGYAKDKTGKYTYGAYRHFKLHAWLDAFLLTLK